MKGQKEREKRDPTEDFYSIDVHTGTGVVSKNTFRVDSMRILS